PVQAILQLLVGGRERAFEIRKDRRRLLLLAALEQLVERLRPALEVAELRVRRRREAGERERRDEVAADHSDASAKPDAPASFASARTRTTSPSSTSRSAARMTTFCFALASPSRSALTIAASSPSTLRSPT